MKKASFNQGGISLLFYAIPLLILLFDIVTKIKVVELFTGPDQLTRPIPIIEDLGGLYFYITYATNEGAAWGFFADWQWPLFAVRVVTIVILLSYLYLHRASKTLRSFAICLLAVGALGNVFDTLIYGHVVDMFLFTFFGYSFAIFNVADSSITAAVVLWILSSFLSPSSSTALQSAQSI